jgi:hypothetical protein
LHFRRLSATFDWRATGLLNHTNLGMPQRAGAYRRANVPQPLEAEKLLGTDGETLHPLGAEESSLLGKGTA